MKAIKLIPYYWVIQGLLISVTVKVSYPDMS